MVTIKLSGRAVAAYSHTMYQTISITIPNYNMVSIHPMIPYSRFIWQEKTFDSVTNCGSFIHNYNLELVPDTVTSLNTSHS